MTTPPQEAASRVPSEAECDVWIDHFLQLAHSMHAKTVAPDEVPTAEQVAQIRVKLAPELMAACRKLERAMYECEVRARDYDELVGCSK